MTDREPGEEELRVLATRVLRSILTGERLVDLSDRLAKKVEVTCPTFHVDSRHAALLAIQDGTVGGESLTEISITVRTLDVSLPRVHLEWVLTGRFTVPCFVDDDVLLEPTGKVVELCGSAVITMHDDQVAAISCYYDQLSLRQQLAASA